MNNATQSRTEVKTKGQRNEGKSSNDTIILPGEVAVDVKSLRGSSTH